MRKQFLISPKRHEVPEAIGDARDQSNWLEAELNSEQHSDDPSDLPQTR
jgi:hypothetical protein